MSRDELGDEDPREAARASKRDRKRITRMVVDGGSLKRVLLARQAKHERTKAERRRSPGEDREV